MSISLTKNARILLSQQLYNLLDIGANSYLPPIRQSYMYVVLGKQNAWNDGTEVIPDASESESDLYDVYRNGMFAKQLSYDNASLVTRRINWTMGTVYSTYDQAVNLFVNDQVDYYVLNSKDQVFKCLSNNNGATSDYEPQLTLSSTSLEEPYLQTEDGYKWKYLYTLSAIQRQKFLDDDWMPVTYNKFVRASAIPGGIDIVEITNTGNNYTNGSTQSIIKVSGDGTGAVLKANVADGHVIDIIIQDRGKNYSYATLTFDDIVGGIGTNASADVILSPSDGHGYDPVHELLAYNIMFNCDFEASESGLFPTENDYRQVSAIHNPKTYGTSSLLASKTATLYTKIKVSPGVGVYTNDETVYQGSTFADATFTGSVIAFDEVKNELYLNNVRGSITNNSTIKGTLSGSIRVVNSTTPPTMQPYSGKVLYISDTLPVRRDPAQTERIRFILSF